MSLYGPPYGTPEHAEWLQELGRVGFIEGHMGAGGRDTDLEREIEDGSYYGTEHDR